MRTFRDLGVIREYLKVLRSTLRESKREPQQHGVRVGRSRDVRFHTLSIFISIGTTLRSGIRDARRSRDAGVQLPGGCDGLSSTLRVLILRQGDGTLCGG
jgi:hypothetical protein